MSIHTLMIFSTQQHHYLAFQRGHCTCQVAACVSQYIWAWCLSVWLGLICLCYIFSHSCHPTTYLSPCHPSLTFPLKPLALPLFTICCHCDQSPFHRTSHLTGMACSKAIPYLVQINSWTSSWSLLPQCPPPSLLLLHLCTSSSSSISTSVDRLVSNWSHISSLVSRNESLPCSPFALSPLSCLSPSLCQAQTPPLTFTLPQPRPVATTVLLQFMGSLQQLSRGEVEGKEGWRETTGEETWEMREGRRAKREKEHTW